MFQKIIITINIGIILSAIIVSSCSSVKITTGNKFDTGEYIMILKDTLKAKLYEGIIEVDKYSKSKPGGYSINGIYYFTRISTKDDPGIGSMKGAFSGNADSTQTKISLNLNPKIADNNLYLNFTINSGLMNGTWSLETMKGTRAKGLLEIKKTD